ncbi:hypothetical protein QE152_g10322 [Popillia japonica]|uniref:Uncharacterized protein n=1 Tax=Popillia japonica TaxID=7064 RepID=A0AAW1LRW5_POPJA
MNRKLTVDNPQPPKRIRTLVKPSDADYEEVVLGWLEEDEINEYDFDDGGNDYEVNISTHSDLEKEISYLMTKAISLCILNLIMKCPFLINNLLTSRPQFLLGVYSTKEETDICGPKKYPPYHVPTPQRNIVIRMPGSKGFLMMIC